MNILKVVTDRIMTHRSEGFIMVAIMFHMFSFIICAAYALHMQVDHGAPIMFLTIWVVAWIGGILAWALAVISETVVSHGVKYVTHGDVYCTGKIYKWFGSEDHTVGSLFLVITMLVTPSLLVICTIVAMPSILVWFIPVIFIGILMKLARFGWGVKRKLDTHVEDPNAHKGA